MKIACDFYTIKSGKRYDLSNPITKAFASLREGIQKSSHEYTDNTDDADVVFVFGSITHRKLDTERAGRIVKHRNDDKKIFALDSALFSPYIRNATNSSETGFFRIGYGDITGEGNFLNDNSTKERYEWFKQAFNFEEKEPQSDNTKPILFTLQSEKGWQYDNTEPYYSWAQKVVARIRSITDREIILRAHPNTDRNPTEWIAEGHENIRITYGDRGRRTILDAIREAGAVVTHSSSSAVESIVEGIPTFALDQRCVAYEACEKDLVLLNNLDAIDWEKREQYLYNWSMTSWHVDEMTNPDLIEYYMRKL